MCAKIVILSDLHLRHHQADIILSWEEPYDQIVFLGDLFDQWSDSAVQADDAARWMKKKLNDPRWVLLAGNHDCAYKWARTSSYSQCSGWTIGKQLAVEAVLSEVDWDKVKPYYAIPEFNLLFSHAGIDYHLFTMMAAQGYDAPRDISLRAITEWLDQMWEQCLVLYASGRGHPLLRAGRSRGGDATIGGITWQDFEDHTPIPNVGQIVGHSVITQPLFRFHQGKGIVAPMWRRSDKGPIKEYWLEGGWTLDLDSNSHHYALLDTQTSTLIIKSVIWRQRRGDIDQTISRGKTIAVVRLPKAIAT